nr:EOG090X0DE4 [Sida crystallina]
MNVTLKDVTLQGNDDKLYRFEDFFVKARNIRYVQIPEDVNISEAIQNQLKGKPRFQPKDESTKRFLNKNSLCSTMQIAGMKNFVPPPTFDHIEIPEKPKLPFLEKVPQFAGNIKPPKMSKKIELMRGPELIHNQFIHQQYGIIALCGGRLHSGHMEMIRMTVNRKMDPKRMFAIWRVDPPWQPLTKKGQGKRMGGGKGAIDRYVTPVKAGRVIVEVGGKCEFEEALPFLRELAGNMPFRAKAISYEMMEARKAEEERLRLENTNPYTAEYIIKNNIGNCHSWISPYDKKWFFKYV